MKLANLPRGGRFSRATDLIILYVCWSHNLSRLPKMKTFVALTFGDNTVAGDISYRFSIVKLAAMYETTSGAL